MRALIYARVSSDPRGRGRSVDEQVTEATTWAERENWDVVEVIRDENRSASKRAKRAREGWARVHELLAAGALDVLVTWEASRAQRDLDAYLELRQACVDHGVSWAYSGDVYDLSDRSDRFRTGLDALIAENEAEQTRERVLRAMRSNAAKGRPHGRLPFGFRRIYDEHTGDLIRQEPDPVQASIVRDAAARFLSGESARSIANHLNAEGVAPPHSGKGWDLTRVRRILTNPAMAGRRVHRGEDVGLGDWAPVLDAETFDALVARFADPSRRSTRQSPTVRLLSGVARCGVCGGPMTYAKQGGFVDKHTGRRRVERTSYQCREKFCTARDLGMLDEFVTKVVVERLRRPDARDALTDADRGEVAEAAAEVAELRTRLDDAVGQFTSGKLSAATLGRIEGDLLPKIRDAEQRAKVVGLPTAAAEVAVADDPAAMWETLLPEQRREVVRALLTVVVMPVKVRGSRGFDPSSVRIEWKR